MRCDAAAILAQGQEGMGDEGENPRSRVARQALERSRNVPLKSIDTTYSSHPYPGFVEERGLRRASRQARRRQHRAGLSFRINKIGQIPEDGSMADLGSK